MKEAEQTAFFFKEIFGKDNFFIEIHDHNFKEQNIVKPLLFELA